MSDHSRLKRIITFTRANNAEAAFLQAAKSKLIRGLPGTPPAPVLFPGAGDKFKSGEGTRRPSTPPASGPGFAGGGMGELTKLTANAAFIAQIKSGIRLQLTGEYGERRTGGLLLKGEVTCFEISAPVIFQRPSGSGSDWRIPFTTRGRAVCGTGGMRFIIEGPVEGFAKIHFPFPVTEPDVLPEGLQMIVAVEEAPV